MQRAMDRFPQQGDRGPWTVRQNYLLDAVTTLNRGRALDGVHPALPRQSRLASYESSAVGTNSYDGRCSR